MSAPALNQFVQGMGSVTADNLNGFEQTCDTFSQLRDLDGTSGMQVFARGRDYVDDGLQGIFYWNSLSTASDDNINILRPIGGAFQGRWVRIPASPFSSSSGSKELSGGTASVLFSTPLPTASYAISLSSDTSGEYITWAGKTINGFNINSSNAASTANVDWIVMIPA